MGGDLAQTSPRRDRYTHGLIVRIAIVSDVHGNLVALQAIALSLERVSPDLIVHGGDLVAIGPRPAEVLDFIREAGWAGVIGNTDEMLFDTSRRAEQEARAPKLRAWLKILFDILAPWAFERLSLDHISWLSALPTHWRSDGITLVHAAPDDLWRAPMPDALDGELRQVYGSLGGDLAVYGHIHRPYVRHLDEFIVANSGSGGLPYDGDPRASYLLIDGLTAEVRRVEYDLEKAAGDAVAAGFPFAEWLSEVQHQARFRTP